MYSISPANRFGVPICPFCCVPLRERHAGILAEETGERFAIDACPKCGLGRTNPFPPDLGAYYGSSYYGRRHGVTERLCTRRRLGLVRRWAGPVRGRALLDFGCGDGSFGAAAIGEGWACSGVERPGEHPWPDGMPVAADLDELNGSSRFEVATFWHVLEHLVDPVDTLARVRDRLEPDGLVIAAVPNFASWQAEYAGAGWLHLDIPRHLWHFSPDALARAFEKAGYRVEGFAQGEIEYDVIGWSQGLLNRWFGGRNEFFRAMSGRPESRRARAIVQVPLGLAFSALMAVPAWVESRIGRGGTLIVAARRTPG